MSCRIETLSGADTASISEDGRHALGIKMHHGDWGRRELDSFVNDYYYYYYYYYTGSEGRGGGVGGEGR